MDAELVMLLDQLQLDADNLRQAVGMSPGSLRAIGDRIDIARSVIERGELDR